jgi:hypothetical protein
MNKQNIRNLIQRLNKVYVYLEKQNSNNFDGFIGFNNNENQKNKYKRLSKSSTRKYSKC